MSEIPRMAEAFGQERELECVCARRPLLEEELGDELKSPGDHRRAEVTLTAITSESAQCVCARLSRNIICPAVGDTLLVPLF